MSTINVTITAAMATARHHIDVTWRQRDGSSHAGDSSGIQTRLSRPKPNLRASVADRGNNNVLITLAAREMILNK